MKRTRGTTAEARTLIQRRPRRHRQTTAALDYGVTAPEVQSAIAELSDVGQGNVSVSGEGSPEQPFVVAFTGALAATSTSLLANFSGITTGSGSQPGSSTQTSWGGPGTDQQEVVGYAVTGDDAVTGGEFTLSYGGDTTGPLAYDSTPAQVQSALAGLADIGANNVEVTGPSGSGIGGTGADVYTVTFVGALGGKYLSSVVSMQSVISSPLVDSQGGSTDIAFESAITRGGSDEVDDVQQVVVTQTSGSFTLGFQGNSTPAQTVGESAAALQTALQALPGLAQVTVCGSGTVASPYFVTFGGDLKGENVSLLGGTGALDTITTSYNADGSISSIGDNDSHYAYTYDGQGNTATADNAGTPGVPDVVLTSQYDAAGNRSSLSATINGTADFLNTYSYNTLSQLDQIQQQGQTGGNAVAPKSVYYGLDALGDVTAIDRSNSVTDGPNENGPGYSALSYNSAGQLTGIDQEHDGTSLDNLVYTYDSLGRVATFSSIDGTATYGYDSVDEVTSAVYTTNPGETQPPDESYDFDPNGNRTTVDGTGTTVGTNNEVSNDGSYAYTFDAEGNRLTRTQDASTQSNQYKVDYSYDYRNRLVEVQDFNNSNVLTEQLNYTYDVYNRLIERVDDVIGGSTTTTYYVWDGDSIVLAFNGSEQLTTRYLNGPNTSAYDQFFTTLAEEDVGSLNSPGTVTWDLLDSLDTVGDIVNPSGQPVDHLNYDSYGVQVYASAPTVTHLDGYAGGFYDPSTGLLYELDRWYDPTATVWITADPSGFMAGDTNLTRYVGNDPTDFIDPSGLAPDDVYVPPADLEGESFNARLAASNERTWMNWDWGAFQGAGELLSDAMFAARQGFDEFVDHPIDTSGRAIKGAVVGAYNGAKGIVSGKAISGAIIDYHTSPTANAAGRKFGREAAKAGLSYGAGRVAGAVLETCPVSRQAVRRTRSNQVRTPAPSSRASNINAATALNKKLSALEYAQKTAASTRTLPDGRIRYYRAEKLARTPGSTRGASFVTEWDPNTGTVRQWMESYDQAGNVVRVHPKTLNGQDLISPHFPPTGKELGQ